MARIFITGSADGLGLLAAKSLVQQGHRVVLHTRNNLRGEEALVKLPGAEAVLIADMSSIPETKQLAADANKLGEFDTVIHNAGVYQTSGELIVAVNTLAPYILTCLMKRPRRLIYLSSGMHTGGQPKLKQLLQSPQSISYSDSKLHDVMLALAVARLWPEVYSNAVNPGWVPTKMGGAGAPDDLQKGYETQAWLAVSNDKDAQVSGRYFFHKQQRSFNPEAADPGQQDEFLSVCEELTGVHFPK